MNLMITGGAGYIGSHAVRQLVARGDRVVALDNLCTGHREAVERAGDGRAPLVEADLRDTPAVIAALREHAVDAVLNFAALSCVGESVQRPLAYWDNNVGGALSLLRAMQDAGVERLVHSSTCAVYGEPERMPITEDTPTRPINPYGASKLAIERVLHDAVVARPTLACAALRYFNVAGASRDGRLGEDHEPETHLVPVLLEVAAGEREHAVVFGERHPTPDGTCLRDYVHVEDLVAAHLMVLDALRAGEVLTYNLGTGRAVSVREMLAAVRAVTRADVPVRAGPPRAGDPPALWADASRIERELGWRAQRSHPEQFVADAWAWKCAQPAGYGAAATPVSSTRTALRKG